MVPLPAFRDRPSDHRRAARASGTPFENGIFCHARADGSRWTRPPV